MQAEGFATLVAAEQLGIGPDRNVRFLQVIEKLLALQILLRGIEQARHGRVGKADHPSLINHQDALGRVVQHRGIESPRRFQIVAQALQSPAIALVLQQRLHLGFEYLWIEGFEQVIHRAAGIALDDRILGLLVGSEENDRCQTGALAAAHQARDLETIHTRHLHIQQHQVDIVFK
ncbi:hypothetical protein D3C73_913440 [compost metagenome]